MPTFFEFFGFFHQNGVIGKVNQCYLLLRLKDKWDGSRPNKMTLRFARITRTVKPRKTHKRVGRKADFLWRENHQDGGSGHNGMQLEVKRLVKFVVPAVRFHCLVYRANFLAIFLHGLPSNHPEPIYCLMLIVPLSALKYVPLPTALHMQVFQRRKNGYWSWANRKTIRQRSKTSQTTSNTQVQTHVVERQEPVAPASGRLPHPLWDFVGTSNWTVWPN